MENTKTAKEWFEMLNEPERSQAINNCIDLEAKHVNLNYCLIDSIFWMDSPEGFDYWNKISKDIENGKYEFIEYADKLKKESPPPDIYKLIDQLIKEGKNQGYKISVTIE